MGTAIPKFGLSKIRLDANSIQKTPIGSFQTHIYFFTIPKTVGGLCVGGYMNFIFCLVPCSTGSLTTFPNFAYLRVDYTIVIFLTLKPAVFIIAILESNENFETFLSALIGFKCFIFSEKKNILNYFILNKLNFPEKMGAAMYFL